MFSEGGAEDLTYLDNGDQGYILFSHVSIHSFFN